MSFQYGVPQPTAAIEAEAQRLQKMINDEIRERVKYHGRLTIEDMVQSVLDKHLNILWEHIRIDQVGDPAPRIQISRYTGEVLEG